MNSETTHQVLILWHPFKKAVKSYCPNIKRSCAAVFPKTINAYFDELENEFKEPPSHIIKYGETNLCDDPGKRKLIFRLGLNTPKVWWTPLRRQSLLYSLRLQKGSYCYAMWYITYWWQLEEKGHQKFNVELDQIWLVQRCLFCFSDWVESTAIPFLKNLEGPKFLIVDNLSSHLLANLIKLWIDNRFRSYSCPNSTHFIKTLDVAFVQPMKDT